MAASNSNHRGTSGGIQLGSAWFQRKINLRPQHRGVHLVTEEILRQMPELGQFSVGLCHVQSEYPFTTFMSFNNMQQCAFLPFPISSLSLSSSACMHVNHEKWKIIVTFMNRKKSIKKSSQFKINE